MKHITTTCDIADKKHDGKVIQYLDMQVIFDHDQEDGKSEIEPHIGFVDIDICKSCFEYMMKNRRYIYAYGAMGNNTYYLKK